MHRRQVVLGRCSRPASMISRLIDASDIWPSGFLAAMIAAACCSARQRLVVLAIQQGKAAGLVEQPSVPIFLDPERRSVFSADSPSSNCSTRPYGEGRAGSRRGWYRSAWVVGALQPSAVRALPSAALSVICASTGRPANCCATPAFMRALMVWTRVRRREWRQSWPPAACTPAQLRHNVPPETAGPRAPDKGGGGSDRGRPQFLRQTGRRLIGRRQRRLDVGAGCNPRRSPRARSV